jgi:ubiquinone/menaquinone biosynthesis C-methylase UbiE
MKTPSPPVSQLDFWNGSAGARWVREQARLDRAFTPIQNEALRVAHAEPRERVLDVGCGCGASTAALAESVGVSGSVVGVDISAPMLGVARQRLEAQSQASFLETDAARATFTAPFDLVFSRFGVMFFDDRVAAFSNLRRALAPRGRLCFVCWQSRDENPWYSRPLAAVAPFLGTVPETPDTEPGPFAFADRDGVLHMLAAAGFTDTAARSFETPIEFSSNGLDEAVTFAIAAGPIARLMLEASDELVGRTRAALEVALSPHLTQGRVALPASVWIVTARA